jgi:hypothetical protein
MQTGRTKTGGRNNEEQTFSHFVFDGFSAGVWSQPRQHSAG